MALWIDWVSKNELRSMAFIFRGGQGWHISALQTSHKQLWDTSARYLSLSGDATEAIPAAGT